LGFYEKKKRRTAMSLLEVKDLSFSYHAAKEALRGINFRIGAGEHTALVGPNGSGKSTLLALLSGYLSPSSGDVYLEGQRVRGFSFRERARRITVLPQNAAIPFPFTCFETVLMGLYPFGPRFSPPGEKSLSLAEDLMRETHVWEFAGKNVNELSGGEFQRVMCTRALVQALAGIEEGSRRLLLLDEPFSELDIASRVTMMKLLNRKAAEYGVTIIGVHHDLNIAARFAGRVLALQNGCLAADGKPGEVFTLPLFAGVFHVKAEILPGKGFIFTDSLEAKA
jgi:iron complex transport system ATP-binding protein